jgi:AmiR/NasT family two-component response regulator
LARSERLVAQLRQALTSRATIDQALGVLMSRSGDGPEQAFERLRTMSQDQHLKLHQVAQTLVDEAVARARARHSAQDDAM